MELCDPREDTLDRQLVKDFGLVHYIVKVRLGGYSGVRLAFAGLPCDPPHRSSITEWKKWDSLPPWTVLRLCSAATVDPIEVLQIIERREITKRAGDRAKDISGTEFDWVPSKLTKLKQVGLFASLVPDVRGKQTDLHKQFEDVGLPYSALSAWKRIDSIPLWALLRVCRWAKADPVEVLQHYEDREVEARTKQQ